jgi:hypothetical protein
MEGWKSGLSHLEAAPSYASLEKILKIATAPRRKR